MNTHYTSYVALSDYGTSGSRERQRVEVRRLAGARRYRESSNASGNWYYYATFTTAFGDFSVAVDQAGAVVGTAFGAETALRARLGKCHLFNDTAATGEVRRQVLAYFAGERHTFDLRLAPAGTAFQQKVWTALQLIPFGETRTYGGLAAKLGHPSASRAVGRANATNPICLIVPCHRVIGANGSLTGFAFGEDIKRRLLEHEGALCPALV